VQETFFIFNKDNHMKNIMIVSAIALYLASSTVFADASHGENGSSVGKPGDPNNVSRSIVLQMTFNRFKPSKINVKRGETIRFILKNISKKKHEMMIGTIDFACPRYGHFKGMRGEIKVAAK